MKLATKIMKKGFRKSVETLQEFIKESVDNRTLLSLNQGVYTFRGTYIVDGRVASAKDNDYAVWSYLGEPRLVDYKVEGAYKRKFGEWPIIKDIKWSQEVDGGIAVKTKPWEIGDKDICRSFEEEE